MVPRAFTLLFAVLACGPLAAMEPGDLVKDCDVCPAMVVVPAGSFTMGSDGRHKQEVPAHEVTVAKPFAIGRFEVTFDEWQACLDDGGCDHNPDDHGWGRGRRPVINITYAQVKAYLTWLRRHAAKPYRLPSEAEWEYAAKAGTTTEFWWGDAVGSNLANCRDCGSK